MDYQRNLQASSENIWGSNGIIVAIFSISRNQNWSSSDVSLSENCFINPSLILFLLLSSPVLVFFTLPFLCFPTTLEPFFFGFFSASFISCLCGDTVTIMALPRLVEVEGGSLIGTICTSAEIINGDDGFYDCDNGAMGSCDVRSSLNVVS